MQPQYDEKQNNTYIISATEYRNGRHLSLYMLFNFTTI